MWTWSTSGRFPAASVSRFNIEKSISYPTPRIVLSLCYKSYPILHTRQMVSKGRGLLVLKRWSHRLSAKCTKSKPAQRASVWKSGTRNFKYPTFLLKIRKYETRVKRLDQTWEARGLFSSPLSRVSRGTRSSERWGLHNEVISGKLNDSGKTYNMDGPGSFSRH